MALSFVEESRECGLNLSTRIAPTPEPVWHPGVSGAEPGLGALPAVQSLGLRPPGPRCRPLGTLPRLGGPDARRAWGRGAALSSCLPSQAGLLAASKPVPQTQSGPQTGSLEGSQDLPQTCRVRICALTRHPGMARQLCCSRTRWGPCSRLLPTQLPQSWLRAPLCTPTTLLHTRLLGRAGV